MLTAPGTHAAPAPAISAPVSAISAPRDRFVDVLRISAILVVVVQHWLMPSLSYDDETLITGNTLATPGAWIVTWVSQAMALVFFAGGATAMYGMRARAGTDQSPWLVDRLRRLVWPAVPLVALWVPLPHLLLAVGMPAQPVDIASRLAGRLLWFLALYVLITALTPALVRLHRRCRGTEVAAMAGAAIVVDVVRFGALDGAEPVGYLNVLFVWAAVYQLGIAYASGSLRWAHGRRAWCLSAVGLAATALAVALGPYPSSMIGMPAEPVSNMNPPTAVLLAVAAFQLGLVLACRPVIERWAENRPVARGLDYLSARLMTVYVWHIPALIVVTGIGVVGYGWSTPDVLSSEWRSAVPIWLATLTLVLSVFVRLFSHVESPSDLAAASRGSATGRGVWRGRAATVLTGLGLLSLAVNGFAPELATHPAGPVGAGLAILIGSALLHARPGTASPRRSPEPAPMGPFPSPRRGARWG
ncbi:acyltransferase family protein [Phytoactinopolyspora endophytica]|uniref:acyltransferase family protein n=1 Tax=Phytoactinopolyspora endophytica TaxID=1642495 RepID=UPI00101D8DF0|nr:acyltransferase [Phytoactinopolyspora endophytica]